MNSRFFKAVAFATLCAFSSAFLQSDAHALRGGITNVVARAGQAKAASGGASDASTIFGSALKAWYRGDSLTQSANVLTQLTDKTANGNNLTPVSTGPSYSATGGPNSKPIITQTTTQAIHETTGFTGFPGSGGMVSTFCVIKPTAAGTGGHAWLVDIDGGYRFDWDATDTIDVRFSGNWGGDSFTYDYTTGGAKWHAIAMFATSSNFIVRVDGVQKYATGSAQTFSSGTAPVEIVLGDSAAQSVAECAFVSGTVTTTQETNWESAVATYYGGTFPI